METLLAIIFIVTIVYLFRPSNFTQFLRSTRSNFIEAVAAYPVPEDINGHIFYSKRFKPCMLQDDISKSGYVFRFKLSEKGILMRESITYIWMRPKKAFVPWCSLVESTSQRRPWNIGWFCRQDVVKLEIKDSPMMLFIRKKDWVASNNK